MAGKLNSDLLKKKTQAETVRKLREKVEEKLGGDEMKASLGDYIRLVQLQQELEEDEPRDIKVTWVDSEKSEKEKNTSGE